MNSMNIVSASDNLTTNPFAAGCAYYVEDAHTDPRWSPPAFV